MTHDQGRLLGNRYRLVATVGRGGMGTVWRAYDEVLDREVAVKEVLLPPGMSTAERDVLYQRTFREARASARLNHPGVVTVHDVLNEDDRPWIVMELVRARSLQDVIDEDGPIAPRTAADIGRQVLAALSHAHQAGILHRDVKPSNVLITDDGRAVLTDFGIAQVEGDSALTQTGLVMGSPAYIAPERVQGERAVPASDLWALGATLYAAVEGRAPYERSDAMAALAAALTEEVPPPRNAGSLRRVLHGLLARSPARRMTAETAMPLLIDVANQWAAPPPHSPMLDVTILDQPVTRNESAALETVLDSTAIEAAARESAASPEAPPRPAAFHQEPGPRSVDEQRTEIVPDWQSPARDPWRQSAGPAHPQAHEQTAYEPTLYEQTAYEQTAYDQTAYEQAAHDQTAYDPATYDQPRHDQPRHDQPRHDQPRYDQPRYDQPRYEQAAYDPQTYERQQYPPQKPGRIKTVVIVLVAAVVVAASLIAGALILKSRLSATGLSRNGDVPGALALPADYVAKTESGFSVSVPSSWSREEKTEGVFFYAPDPSTFLQIGRTQWEVNTASAQAAVSDLSFAKLTRVFPGYAKKSIKDSIPYWGTQASDLEFTYTTAQGGVVHAVDRFVLINGSPYAIYFRCLEKDWDLSQTTLHAIYHGFKPDGA